jgi:hypothetical protein
MAKSPDHMRGINALPSTQAYKAAVAAARSSAPRTPEQRRAVNDQLEALRMKAMRDRNEQFPLERNPFGKHGTLAKSINKQLKKRSQQASCRQRTETRAAYLRSAEHVSCVIELERRRC